MEIEFHRAALTRHRIQLKKKKNPSGFHAVKSSCKFILGTLGVEPGHSFILFLMESVLMSKVILYLPLLHSFHI